MAKSPPTIAELMKLGLSNSYASLILNGKRRFPRALACHLYATTGWQHDSIAGLTDHQIAVLNQIEPWQGTAPRQAAQ